jgi:hypothetical protein
VPVIPNQAGGYAVSSSNDRFSTFATRAFTVFFKRAVGKGLPTENWIVPFASL